MASYIVLNVCYTVITQCHSPLIVYCALAPALGIFRNNFSVLWHYHPLDPQCGAHLRERERERIKRGGMVAYIWLVVYVLCEKKNNIIIITREPSTLTYLCSVWRLLYHTHSALCTRLSVTRLLHCVWLRRLRPLPLTSDWQHWQWHRSPVWWCLLSIAISCC